YLIRIFLSNLYCWIHKIRACCKNHVNILFRNKPLYVPCNFRDEFYESSAKPGKDFSTYLLP
ncbi:MAG: hypothetical protein QXJ72_08175, partial [Thermoproteota archaeon]